MKTCTREKTYTLYKNKKKLIKLKINEKKENKTLVTYPS